MLLALDVGNTNVTIGVFDGDRLAHSWRLAALRERTADELGIFVTRLFEQVHVPISQVDGIAVARPPPLAHRAPLSVARRKTPPAGGGGGFFSASGGGGGGGDARPHANVT